MDPSPISWRKSTYSIGNGDNCVEVARAGGTLIAVRDSKNPGGPMLTFSRGEWRAFIGGLKSGSR
jgi:hypothetical protein